MRTPPTNFSLIPPILMFLLPSSRANAQDQDDCPPGRWSITRDVETGLDTITWLAGGHIETPEIQPGEINCRLWSFKEEEVNHDTCMEIADGHDMEMAEFFFLNPDLKPDCSNIEPHTTYCVRGCMSPSSQWKRPERVYEHPSR